MNNTTNNINQIDKKIANYTLKRVHNEIIELYSKYKNIKVKYTEEIIFLEIKVLKNSSNQISENNHHHLPPPTYINIEIQINNKYPFHAPAIFINTNPYIKYLTIKSNLISKILKKYNKFECLCCNSIICGSNCWTATYHIQKIIDEINYINELKQKVKYEIAVINLCDKHKIPEDICANILKYLHR